MESGLRITSLELRDFRSYGQFSLDGLGDLTLLIGPNGVGKTNVLEAVALMTSTQSFRRAQIAQLLREGCENAFVRVRLSDGNRDITGELSLEPGKKRYKLNGKDKRTADVRGLLPAVAFTPDDLQLVKKGSTMKRDALDDLGMQLTANYYIVRRDYEKVVRYKNRLLKDEAPADLVASIDEMLVTCGSQLFCYRVALMQRMMPLLASTYKVIAGRGAGAGASADDGGADSRPAAGMPPVPSEDLQAEYRASWQELGAGGSVDLNGAVMSREDVREALQEALDEHRAQELARKRSLVGPHNDKISLLLNGRDAALYASQGQQRSIVLAWKLAEVECVRQSLGTNPVLLLDDVMSELDAGRRDTLVRFVTDEVQTFITATDLSGFNDDLLQRAAVVELPR